MHLGLICPPVTGHLNPMTTLGLELAGRGQRVVLLAPDDVHDRVQQVGLEFLAIGRSDDPDRPQAADWEKLGSRTGFSAVWLTCGLLRQATATIRGDLPVLVERSGIDGLVVDQFSPAAAVVAESIGIPYVVACCALACYPDAKHALPPPPTLWRYRTDWLGRMRNRVGTRMLRAIFDRVAGGRGPQGVPPLLLAFEAEAYGLAHVAQQPAFFDFPRRQPPDHLHYTAPWHRSGRDADVPFPWQRLDGRPLVYASLGTLQNRLRHVYEAIAEAAAVLDVQLVLSLGSRQATLAIPERKNVIVVPYAPQLALLDRAAAAITHAGLNTALECLARGVPMLCLPVTNDQPGVARRIEWLGAGEVLPIRRTTATRIRRMLVRIIEMGCFREQVARYQQELAGTNGVALAADIIERALSTRRRVDAGANDGRAAGIPQHS